MVNSNLVSNNLCGICDAELTVLGNCYVCKQCKAVACVGSADNETVSSNIKATIESIQQYDEEKAIHEYCLDFQDCKDCLQSFMKGRLDFKDIDFRQKLYKLLELSLEFKEVFGSSCVELEL